MIRVGGRPYFLALVSGQGRSRTTHLPAGFDAAPFLIGHALAGPVRALLLACEQNLSAGYAGHHRRVWAGDIRSAGDVASEES